MAETSNYVSLYARVSSPDHKDTVLYSAFLVVTPLLSFLSTFCCHIRQMFFVFYNAPVALTKQAATA